MASLKAGLKLLALVLWSLLLVPLQLLVMLFTRGRVAFWITRLWHRGVCAVLGLKVRVEGQPVRDRQAVFVSNHISHFDIPVIGRTLHAAFVAKGEMRDWPVAGFMARLQQTVFISRKSQDGKEVTRMVAEVMAKGRSLVLFPEGTTSSGTSVATFKSTLFAILFPPEPAPWLVQPFTIVVEAADGRAVTDQRHRDIYAFYGEMQAGPHAWNFLKRSGATLRLVFHAPIESSPEHNRKSLAAMTQQIIASALPGPT